MRRTHHTRCRVSPPADAPKPHSAPAHTAPPAANAMLTAFTSPRPISAPSSALYQYVSRQPAAMGKGNSAASTTRVSAVKKARSGERTVQMTAESAANTAPPTAAMASPAPAAASSPADALNREATAFATVFSAPAVMEAMDTIWNRSTCAAPSTTPSRDAQTLVAPHTATTFSTRPIMDPTSRVNSHASAGSNVYPPSKLER
mmetsp:Transcript_10341/g.25402  ORF Transcript_10341/g.25402 Transcript_10341/m.25402 type:complete len:203 (+) Transcript_10341:2144-2752(+)